MARKEFGLVGELIRALILVFGGKLNGFVVIAGLLMFAEVGGRRLIGRYYLTGLWVGCGRSVDTFHWARTGDAARPCPRTIAASGGQTQMKFCQSTTHGGTHVGFGRAPKKVVQWVPS